ncbi:glycosyltransferase family 2 protein, partial [Alphaproteobacteria bacterium]|nr:glycosyltransferase family 2 protein [Alphaproteobacteria bacterium]
IVIDAIKSCLEQTIPPNEIIIVDDNSSNDELIKLKSNIKLLSNNTIKVIELKKNNGPSHCRNHGVNSSNFNVIFFLDTDDLWLDNKIEKHLQLYKISSVDSIYDNQFYINENNIKSTINFDMIDDNFINALFNGWGPPNLSSLSIRKDIFIKLGGLDPNLRFSEDQDLFINFDLYKVNLSTILDRLTFFRNIATDRVSYDTQKRITGTLKFLSKWESLFKCRYGKSKYLNYKNNYISNFVHVLALYELKKFNLIIFLSIFCKFLLFNKYFYIKFFNKIYKKIFSK